MSVIAERLECLLDSSYPGAHLIRIEQPVGRVNALEWLSMQKGGCRTYWADREGEIEIAALGCAWQYELESRNDINPCIERVNHLLATYEVGQPARCLGYISFSDSESAVWPKFGYGRFFLPMLEITQTRKGGAIACNLVASDENHWKESIRAALKLIRATCWQQTSTEPQLSLGSMTFSPTESQWGAIVDQALTGFATGEMEKVVLSRATNVGFNGQLNPWKLLLHWRWSNPRSYLFAFESDQGIQDPDVFLGCSPERLFSRQGQLIRTEALAGTASRGRDRQEDFQMELRLLNDRKNLHENRLVLDDIQERLERLCSSLESDRSHSVVKLRTVQHLRFLFRGILKQGAGDAQLLSSLHPTPAVGGSGREAAIQFIEEYETYSRGLYSGVSGYISKDSSEMSVSIRSGLLQKDSISLYSGAGIVQGSDAGEEWQELNNKILTVLNLLKDVEARVGRQGPGMQQVVGEIASSSPSPMNSTINSCEPANEVSLQAF